MVSLVGAAVAVFVVTNIDDLVLLTALFSQPGSRWQSIVAGQYLGLTALVALSCAAALGLVVVPSRWVGLLGVIPLVLGIRGLLVRREGGLGAVPMSARAIAGLTIGSGADNVSVYVPVFRRVGVGPTLGYLVVFALVVAIWCALAAYVASRKVVVTTVERWGAVLIPVVFIAIGAVLIASSLRG